jgi:hypothetical protein
LTDLESGRCRIVVCTDAFGLGVDISNIERIIQWGVDEKLSISSLTQRVGRAARNQHLIGQAIIYVNKSIIEAVSTDWEAGWRTESPDDLSAWVDTDSSDDDDSPRVVPISKMRRLERFGLPVIEETRGKVSGFVRNIYMEAKSLKEAHRIAKLENKGTRKNRLIAVQKIDPAVLWVLCTIGCRNRAILSIYKDGQTFHDTHRGWCCDRCAKRHVDTVRSGPSEIGHMAKDADVLKSSVSFLQMDPASNKIILLSPTDFVTQPTEFTIPRLPVCQERREELKKRIYVVRKKWWDLLNFQSVTLPNMLLPDEVINHIVQEIRKITSVQALRNELRIAKFDDESSLLPSNVVPLLYTFIEQCLHANVHLEPPIGILKPSKL